MNKKSKKLEFTQRISSALVALIFICGIGIFLGNYMDKDMGNALVFSAGVMTCLTGTIAKTTIENKAKIEALSDVIGNEVYDEGDYDDYS